MKRRSRILPNRLSGLALFLVALAALLLSAVPARSQGGTLGPTLNGDDRHDLAVGHPYEEVYHGGNQANAGAASVIYGAAGGLAPAGAQTWHQGWTVENPPGFDNLFGYSLAMGDFNGDEYYDLAVGIPGEDIGGKNRAGAVHVFHGGSAGLSTVAGQFWHLDRPGVGGVAGEQDAFGHALVAADFDGDGYDDLAVGAPGYDLGPLEDMGVVSILYGSPSGLATPRYQFWYQGPLAGLADEVEEGDRFGHSLGAGDFNCDGRADLAIGVPEEDLEKSVVIPDAGVVHVLYGAGNGLSAAGDQLWDQDALGLSQDRAQDGDEFGYALAGGDYDGNGCSDLAVGVPGEAVGGLSAGAVNVIYSDGNGLSLALPQFWTQDILPSAPGGAAAGDQFGHALAAGDFNADGRDDLAVGVPGEQIATAAGAGAANIIYGSGSGLSTATGDQFFRQPLTAGGSPAEDSDGFGLALASGDFDGNGAADLAVGVPREDQDGTGVANTGLVQVLYGQAGRRLSGAGSQTWDEGDLGGLPQEGDQFGFALASRPLPSPWLDNQVYLPLVVRNRRP